MERIVITIKKGTSQIIIKPEGFNGPACIEATKSLERNLGKVTGDQSTGEMYREAEQHDQASQ